MELNPVPVLMFAVIYSNIGGALTPVGDPPNVIIASNSYISSNVSCILNKNKKDLQFNVPFTGRQLRQFHGTHDDSNNSSFDSDLLSDQT